MYLIVEIGCGSRPSTVGSSFWLKNAPEYVKWFEKSPDAMYIGLERDPVALMRVRADVPRHERIRFVRGSGVFPPFGWGTVDEVVMCNVLGDMEIKRNHRRAMIRAAAHIVVSGGTLRIVETYSPLATSSMPYCDDLLGYIERMEGTPFRRLSDEEIGALSEHERLSDKALGFDECGADTWLGPQAFVARYRRT